MYSNGKLLYGDFPKVAMSKLRKSNYPAPAAVPVETVSVWRLLSLVPGLGLALVTVLASTNIATSAHRNYTDYPSYARHTPPSTQYTIFTHSN